jgi:outer membrane protein assembly factor BamB
VASGYTVVLLGYVDNQPSIRVAGYSAETGEYMWGGFQSASVLDSYEGAVYIGTRLGQLQKLNPSSGRVEWSKFLFPLRIVTSINAGDEGVIVVGGGDSSLMVGLDGGERLDIPDLARTTPVLNIDHSSVYIDSMKSLSAVDGRVEWSVSLSEGVREAPVFLPQSILVRTGERSGHIYSVDRNTGTLRWKSDRDAVSNISVSGGWAYFLEEGGYLIRLDADSGEEEILGRLEGAPFVLPSSSGMPAGGYYVSAADDLDMIFLLLGDSAELVALARSG